MSGQVLVEARGIVKQYPGVRALDGANIRVHAGEVLGFLGKNGAGKSTVNKILGGAVQPDGGTLTIDGEEVHFSSPQDAMDAGIAVVHQEITDVPQLSAAENVFLGLGYPRRAKAFVGRRALRQQAADVLARLESEIDPGTRQERLSIAQRRLVMIARGLVMDARLLVLDEPSASLTTEEIQHLHGVVRRLRDQGVAVVYVTHRLEEVFSISDRVVVMRDGRDVFEAPTADVSQAEVVHQILGDAEQAELARTAKPATSGEELLRVDGLSAPPAVEDVSFSLGAGEILGIAGLVGAGRTELVRAICGADRPATGTITLHGEPLRIRSPRDAVRAGIVLLPEDRRQQGTVQEFSVRKNVTLAALPKYRTSRHLAVPSGTREREATAAMVTRLGIKVADVERPVRYLSGGNQQKVVLAKYLESDADVYIFDEPTHGIDVEGKEDVYAVMEALAAEGKGVIFISSEFSELIGVCSRALVLREGRMVGDLKGADLTDAALVERCYAAA